MEDPEDRVDQVEVVKVKYYPSLVVVKVKKDEVNPSEVNQVKVMNQDLLVNLIPYQREDEA